MHDMYPTLAHLPVAEKLQLIGDLWDDISARQQEIPLLDWQREELERRIQSYETHPDDCVSWEDLQQSLLQDAV